MRIRFLIGATLAAGLFSLSVSARDDLRTANGILNLVDKGLRIVSPKPQPPPPPPAHTVVVPVNVKPAPVVVCAYPENSYVTPVVAPWNAAYVVPSQVVVVPASQPIPLRPAKIRWRR